VLINCRVKRGKHVESIHSVYAVAVDASGEIIFSSGDPNYYTCFRSAFKPFQAAAVIRSGAVARAGFSKKHIALMCASHRGEKKHVETAKEMINSLGLSIEAYECGVHYPSDQFSRREMVQKKRPALALHNNCSGKHAGMLALARHLGTTVDGYIKKDHPVQKNIFSLLKEYTGLDKISTSIDGCSAPTPFLTLTEMANLYQIFGSSRFQELNLAYDSMVRFPFLVSGTGGFDTDFIKALKGKAVTKIGGEAIRGVSVRSPDRGSVGIALKVLDGNFRALSPATMKVLEHLGFLSDSEKLSLKNHSQIPLKNHNDITIGLIDATID
tara:strand:- start:2879 stop:3856 length:978 start_codon:yes stop_codon:yes gene_type:complete